MKLIFKYSVLLLLALGFLWTSLLPFKNCVSAETKPGSKEGSQPAQKLPNAIFYDSIANMPFAAAELPQEWILRCHNRWDMTADNPVAAVVAAYSPNGLEAIELVSGGSTRLYYSETKTGGFFYSTATDPQLQMGPSAILYPQWVYSGTDYVYNHVCNHTYKIGDLGNPDRNFTSVEVEKISEEIVSQEQIGTQYMPALFSTSEVKALLHTVDTEGRKAKMLLYMQYTALTSYADQGQGSYSYFAEFGPFFSIVYQYPKEVGDKEAEAFADDVLASFTVYPLWQETSRYFAEQARVLQQKLKGNAQAALLNSLKETQAYIESSRQEVIQGMAESNAEQLDSWTDILTQRQDVENPLNGNELTVSNQYNHVWVTDDNQVLYSDDASFNPNDFEGFGGSTWREANSK